ncbi:hypothetical protein Hore_17210 [Halothermothrix orenii H 168]|uniref:Uncharacterized protein n=1 Tax=Halothermothrix orenii (strain H 168 / OCM 544 / DSM 9562) TaxID=373903 RepID=B8CYV1_HALOH|nr:hypothetical protein Hore_17210 [Halothermothrix orenii H 168]
MWYNVSWETFSDNKGNACKIKNKHHPEFDLMLVA